MEKRQKGYFLYAAVIVVGLLLVMGQSAPPAYAASDPELLTLDLTAEYRQTDARSMLTLVNDLRTGTDAWYWNESDTQKTTCQNLGKLTYDYKLEKVAMQRAMELVLAYSHDRPNGKKCFTAYDEAGVSYRAAAENIAIGSGSYTTAEEVFEGWAEENEMYAGQGHRRNMLSEDVTAIGIGHVIYKGTHYWVQEFANPASGAAQTPASDGEKTVAVELLKSDLQDFSVNASPNTYRLSLGESRALPNVWAELRMKDTWTYAPSVEIPLSAAWKTEDPSCVEVSSNNVSGLKAGTTYLTTTVELNGTHALRIPVTVSSPEPINNAQVRLQTDTYIYDGTEKKPAVQSVVLNGKRLSENQDYTVSYRANVNAGTGWVTVEGTGAYCGKVEKSFLIGRASQTITVPSSYTKTYGNKAFNLGARAKTALTYKSANPDAAAVDASGTVTLKGPGKTTITITAAATSQYNGASKQITITVKPKKAVLKTAKPTKKRTLKVTWKRDAKATGYQVAIAQNKKFKKGKKTALIKKNKTTSKTFKKLKSRKNYYYKVRAYKQVGKTKIYGSYSKVKKVKVR